VLWRHGQTAWNLEHRFQGQSDVPLNEVGLAQADRAAQLIAALHPTAIYSSDMIRAGQTAEPLAQLTGLPVRLDKDLRERSGGLWEGLTGKQIREQYPEAYRTWTPPEGESTEAVGERAAAAFERIAESVPSGSLAVVVSHGAAIGIGMSRLLGLPEQDRVLGTLSNCSWSVVGRRGGRWRLLEHNVGALPEPSAGGSAGS
jgi:broad specificity phosphatase PhoE